jgi:uncharacterized protein YdeI (BOF family)
MRAAAVALVLCLVSGALFGCRPSEHVLGQRPEGGPLALGEVRGAPRDRVVTVSGRMVEKCPVAGCWFYLEDKTGKVRVDTKNAGFVVVDVPVGTVMSVAGRVHGGTDEIQIVATGLRY